MPKQVIISMQENYPFGECEESTNQMTRVLVRKIYKVSLQERNKLMEKVNVLRKLKGEHMIKMQSALEEQESIHLLFEYIPIKLQTWISNINDQFIEHFRDQLIKFSSFLANNYIQIEFQLKNIGMDQNYGAKYFLDINFELDTSINRQKLKSNYIRELTNLFKPYILNMVKIKPTPESDIQVAKSKQPIKGSQTIRKQDSAISPPTNKSKIQSKDKAMEKYYQQVGVDSQNQKIMQQFMDVLDNQGDEPNCNLPASAAKQQVKYNPSSFHHQNVRNSQNSRLYQAQSSEAIYSQKQFHQDNKQKPTIFSNKTIAPSKPNEGAYFNPQTQDQNNKTLKSTQSMGRGKSELKNMSEVWRQSADIQSRVKEAIQKSLTVIKKFKAIKQAYQS